MEEIQNILRQVETKQENHIKVRENNISNLEWDNINQKDLWIYNKLTLSRRLGYLCGPTGVDVPRPNRYIVRPAINFCGMGRFSRIEYLEKSTEHLHPAEFWCEIFTGDHISVDFYENKSKLVVKGYKNPKNPSYKWNSWIKIEKNVEFPTILNDLYDNYPIINCEFIGNKLIEVQIRSNLDFRWGNTIAIPVWKGDIVKMLPGFRFVEDEDYNRIGFFIK